MTITHHLPGSATVAALPTGTGWDCSATVIGSATLSCTYTPSSPILPGTTLPGVSARVNVPSAVAGGFNLASASAVTDGGVFAYGDAGFFGSHASSPLSGPIVGIAS